MTDSIVKLVENRRKDRVLFVFTNDSVLRLCFVSLYWLILNHETGEFKIMFQDSSVISESCEESTIIWLMDRLDIPKWGPISLLIQVLITQLQIKGFK